MLIAQRALLVGNENLVEGDLIEEMAGRSWGPLISAGSVLKLTPTAVATVLRVAMPLSKSEDPESGVLIGSKFQPAEIVSSSGSGYVNLGDLIAPAFEKSGLSLIAWNALPEVARETLIWAEYHLGGKDVPELTKYEGAGVDSPADPGEPPEGPHMLFDPAVHGLKYRGSVVGYWIVNADNGANVAQISKAQYQRLKPIAQKGVSLYVELTESDQVPAGIGAGDGDVEDQAAA